ncbi:autotransporter domain-containing protein [Novosphingobium sp. FSY-8]|uniref:Autotransporter domain-containing protein n=1 Tax=Novosphingobium ovatum TaxID=1908523 RepID=A0ABW9X8V2_9SPHN|nr:autotransporter domain-containing protein [Novosphingobium ovatum]NBC34961.1 autotransporter domain-containing protein [Novosphingobium ovatum]
MNPVTTRRSPRAITWSASASVLAATLCLANPALAADASGNDFVNAGFETGDTTGWVVTGGYRPSGGGAVTASDYAGSPNSVTVVSQGTDAITGLPTVFAGDYAVRINDSNNNYSINAISQTVSNYGSSTLYVAWSAVMSPSHPEDESATMHVVVTDVTDANNTFVLTDEVYNASDSSVNLAAFQTTQYGELYTGWVVNKINTTVGHDYNITIYVGDCIWGGHYGYAYVDAFSQLRPVSNPGVESTSSEGGVIDAATDLFWVGGSGTWDVVSLNWNTGTQQQNTPYSTTQRVTVFSGTPGTVTVNNTGGTVTAGDLSFTVGGYILNGGTITFGGTTANINVGDGTPDGAGYVATIYNTLAGNVAVVKTGLGTLVLYGNNTFSGGLRVQGGTVTATYQSLGTSTVDLDLNTTLNIYSPSNNASAVRALTGPTTLSNAFGGTGTINFYNTDTVIMTGTSTISGTANVLGGGRVQIGGAVVGQNGTTYAGSMANANFVVTNGSLGGYGTIGSLSMGSGTTLAPGGSIGTLTVAGNFVQGTGSTYAVELTSTGSTDLLAVGGTATIQSGTTLNVTKTDTGAYQLGRRYTILTAAGGRTGTYGSVTGDTAVSYFYSLVPTYAANAIYLDVAKTRTYASAGLTPNQIAAGTSADTAAGRIAAGTVLDSTSLLYAMGNLQSRAAGAAALDVISGEVHASVRAAAMEDSQFVRNAVLSQRAYGSMFWAYGYGSWGHANGDGNAATYARNTSGMLFGSQLELVPHLTVGSMFGIGTSKLALSARGSSADTNDLHAGFFGRIDGSALSLVAGVGLTRRDTHTSRSVTIGTFSESAKSRYNVIVKQFFAQASYRKQLKGIELEPSVGVAYVDVTGRSAAEDAATSRLGIREGGGGGWLYTVGLRGAADLGKLAGVPIKATGGVQYRLAEHATTFTADNSLLNGSTFRVASVPTARSAALLDLGLEAKLAPGLVLSAAYTSTQASNAQDSGLRGSLTFTF